jgi:subtilisin family serine protease
MKTIAGFSILALALGCTAALAAAIDPALSQSLATISPDQKLPVNFVLKVQANALDLDPSIANLPRPERRARVGRVLMDFAEAAQRDLLAYLKTNEVEGKVEDIKPLWIVNSIGCRATREVIYEVAARTDVDLVCYDRVPCELENPEQTLRSLRLSEETGTDGIPQNMVVTNVRGAWNQGYHGEGIVLGFVDTGVGYTHLDLRSHLWTSSVYPHCGFNFASYQHNPPGPSPYDTLTPLDFYGHGTYVAGVATADGAYGQGSHETLGIAPAARVMVAAVDVTLHSPYPDTVLENNVFEGIQFCIRPPRDTLNGADVVNLSLGLISAWLPSLAKWRIVEENVLAAGLVNTVAAGNEYSPGTIRCPGNCPPPWPNPANGVGGASAVITTGATDNDDNLASFSSRGPTDVWDTVPPWNDYAYPPGLTDPDVVMPGVNIPGPYMGDSGYTSMSGTSMSTPGAAGVVCLMLSKNPNLTPREIDSILELYAVRDLGVPGKDSAFGAGRIDCSLAVAFSSPTGTAEPPVAAPQSPGLLLSPNPCRGIISLRLTANGSRPATISIHDASGRLVRQLALGACAEARLTDLPDGVYLVQLDNGAKRSQTERVVLIH